MTLTLRERTRVEVGALWVAGHRLLTLLDAEQEAHSAYLDACQAGADTSTVNAAWNSYLAAHADRVRQMEQLPVLARRLDAAENTAVRAAQAVVR